MTGEQLRFSGVTVGYGSRAIVHDASFSVAPGEFVGLVGPNGAGKSTLLRAITGGADVAGGTITWGADPLPGMPERDRARLVGVVPQTPATIFAFTARAFVEMGRHPHLGRLASPGPRDRAIVEEAMARTDTARLADERVDELSGGDLQRLTLAQALAQQPAVLLLDEPTSHLDLNHTLQVLELVRSLTAGGMAVLGVFHDLGLAARYADRIAVVADRRVSEPKPPADALDAEVISRVFGVRAVVRTDPVTGSVAVTPVLRDADLAMPSRSVTVGLVCGSGAGGALMRRLALEGYSIFAGALNEGDVDHAIAAALGASRVDLPAFGEITEATSRHLESSYADCACTVVCPTPFGRANLPNLAAALHSHRPLILVGEMGDDRDFTSDGAARALWAAALEHGAVRVDSDAEALSKVAEMTGEVR